MSKPYTFTERQTTDECATSSRAIYFVHRRGKFDKRNGTGCWLCTCDRRADALKIMRALNGFEAALRAADEAPHRLLPGR